MRLSCNGCRVLRKGCSDSCSIRPCLQWIKSPESQANATVFLAKFYGRAGLLNLINAGPDHLRPAMFRSLLYEACGRIVNPIYGSVGLLWSGSWQLCQSAVESVLKGAPIVRIPSEAEAGAAAADSSAATLHSPIKSYDIRHICKHHPDAAAAPLHKSPSKSRTRFKRSASKPHRPPPPPRSPTPPEAELDWSQGCYSIDFHRAPSHESSASHASDVPNDVTPDEQTMTMADAADSHENDSGFSADTVEASHVSQAEPTNKTDVNDAALDEDGVLGLELTLGFLPAAAAHATGPPRSNSSPEPRCDVDGWVELGLELPPA